MRQLLVLFVAVFLMAAAPEPEEPGVTEIIIVTVCGKPVAYIFVFSNGRSIGYDVREAGTITAKAAGDDVRHHRLEIRDECPPPPIKA